MMGLGAIIGTGVFVSIGIAAGVASPAVILAIALAAVVATCNALSSAQLAANHPVSGGTYEYGYVYLRPSLGFTAGWMFICAKVASAATAALGFAGYLLHAAGDLGGPAQVPVAIAAVAALTMLVLTGMRRSNAVNIAIVAVTLGSLALFIVAGAGDAVSGGRERLSPFFCAGPAAEYPNPFAALMQATALMFVAFTGYGRIATLGEEVREPRTTIPGAIICTLVVSAALYIAVAAVAVSAAGADSLYAATKESAAPLEVAASRFAPRPVAWLVALGAVTAMLGVLLNLILGLSRVVLAMARRGDAPQALARLNAERTTPYAAVTLVGLAIAALALVGDVKTTWSFSAFTVLIYYAITNVAAIALPRRQRLYHPAIAWCGLAACLGLAFWVDREIWIAGLGLVAIGLVGHWTVRRLRRG
jgi:APA family basic amino acid/polyamine antiporter